MLYGFEYGTTRLAGVRAVRKTAVATDLENLPEIMTHFFPLKIKRTEALDARCVDYG